MNLNWLRGNSESKPLSPFPSRESFKAQEQQATFGDCKIPQNELDGYQRDLDQADAAPGGRDSFASNYHGGLAVSMASMQHMKDIENLSRQLKAKHGCQ